MFCIFCQIISREVPSEVLYEDEKIIAFRDIDPQAPVHIILVPKEHIATLAELADEQMPLLGQLAGIANQLAEKEGISEKGYRLVVNSGPEGGQLVPHLHMHLLGGCRLSDSIG